MYNSNNNNNNNSHSNDLVGGAAHVEGHDLAGVRHGRRPRLDGQGGGLAFIVIIACSFELSCYCSIHCTMILCSSVLTLRHHSHISIFLIRTEGAAGRPSGRSGSPARRRPERPPPLLEPPNTPLLRFITPPSLIGPMNLHVSAGANPHYQFRRGNKSPPINKPQ